MPTGSNRPYDDPEDDGAPTAEVPRRPEPNDPAADTAEAPALNQRRPGAPVKRRSLSKGDKVKLWIILLSPLVFIVLVAGLFFIKDEDGVSMFDRFKEQITGSAIPEEERTGKARMVEFIKELDESVSNVEFYTEEMDKIEAAAADVPPRDIENLDPLKTKADGLVKALTNIVDRLGEMKTIVVRDYEKLGKDVTPSSAELQRAIVRTEPLKERALRLSAEIDKKMWAPTKAPPPTEERIIESGDHKKEEEAPPPE